MKEAPTRQDFSRMAYCFMHMIRTLHMKESSTVDLPDEIVVTFHIEALQELENEGWTLDYRAGHDPDCYEWRIVREPENPGE
jgi:hypothetical protein